MRTIALWIAMAAGCGPGGDASPASAPPAEPAPVSADEAHAPRGEPTAADGGEAKATASDRDETAYGEDPSASAGDDEILADARPELEAIAASRSTSKGSPNAGSLEGGVPLPLRAPGLWFLPHKDPGSRHGTIELVRGLVGAAATVEADDPGAPLSVGDLSREQGGPIPSHASHRSGRDVDVLFYLVRESDGQPFLPSKFIPLDPEGRGTDYGDLADPADDVPVRIDLPRTWRFVAALLGDERTAVQKILLVEHLRSRLLEEAARQGAPEAIVQRFAEVTCQPRFPHDDHMHIRVFCSADDIEAGCEDTQPIFPWRKRELAAQGVTPKLAGSDPETAAPEPAPKPKLKTIEQARAEAGPMHEDVVAFLDRRQAWAKRPHPGRRYCR